MHPFTVNDLRKKKGIRVVFTRCGGELRVFRSVKAAGQGTRFLDETSSVF